MQDEEYRGVDERLLDDFQRELDAEKKANKAKMTKVGVGLVLGLLVAGGFALFSGIGSDGPASEPAAPMADGAGAPPMVDDLVTPRGVGDDEELATLAGQNLIEEDQAPPGSLMKEGVATEPVLVEEPPQGKAPPEPNASLTPPSSAGVFFALQMKAFDDAEKAIAERDRLVEQGLDGWIGVGKGERRLYTVDVGSFRSATDANKQSAPLKYHGYPNEATLVGEGGEFTLRVGSYRTQSEATSTANRVSGSGFPATVHTSSEPITLQLVRVGRYATKEEAEAAGVRLREKGMPSLGVVAAQE